MVTLPGAFGSIRTRSLVPGVAIAARCSGVAKLIRVGAVYTEPSARVI